jgi:hypothetical protein
MSEPLTIESLNPPLNVVHVTKNEQLGLVEEFIGSTSEFGFDVETNVEARFTDRRLRTIQIGNRSVQFVIDMLGLAGSTSNLMDQGHFKAPSWAGPLVDVLRQGLESGNHTKLGFGLQFDYEMVKWCLGLRAFNLYDCILAEKVIYCGRVPFFKQGFWAMDDIAARYLNFRIDKSLQKSFDLASELTDDQLRYAAFDTRIPFSVRQCQLPTILKAGLKTTVDIENNAIPSFGDLHVNGVLLDKEAWLDLVHKTEIEHVENVKLLDNCFIPVVGSRDDVDESVDVAALERVWREETDREKRAQARLAYQAANRTLKARVKASEKWEGQAAINYGSADQLLTAMRSMGISEKELPDTNDKTLEPLSSRYPVIEALKRYRKTSKIDSTYGAQFPENNIYSATGRVHSKFHQLGAETGRVSSSGPNMQNIPNGLWRTCFKARKGYKLVTVDMSGAELRITAEASGEESWIDAFSKGIDVHSVCAQMMMPEEWAKEALDDCKFKAHGKQCSCPGHKKIRKWAKAINFGVMYGKEFRALADALGITTKAAKELLAGWRATFKKVQAYLVASGEYAQMHLCARTMAGRRRLFTRPDWDCARVSAQEQAIEDGKDPQAITNYDINRALKGLYSRIDRQGKNTPIQGANADIIKVAMDMLWRVLEPKYGALIVLMVHDEVVFECPEENADAVYNEIMQAIRDAGARFMKRVVMEAEGCIGDVWSK